MSVNINSSYGFMYTDCDGKVYNKVITNGGDTWHECLNDFVRFLESIYGYEIMSQVRVQEPRWLSSVLTHSPAYLDPWTGEYFVEDDEKIGEDALGEW